MVYFARIMLTAGKIRLLLALAIVAAIAGIVGMAIKRVPPQGQTQSEAIGDKGNQAALQLRGIRVNETTDGTTRWHLVAEKADYEANRSVVHLADVRLTVAPIDTSLGELNLTSPTATYNTETKDVALSGGVKARSSKGMEFTSPSVRFLGARGVVTTTDTVKFSDKDLTLEGIGMEYAVESGALKIQRNVTATVRGGVRR